MLHTDCFTLKRKRTKNATYRLSHFEEEENSNDTDLHLVTYHNIKKINLVFKPIVVNELVMAIKVQLVIYVKKILFVFS